MIWFSFRESVLFRSLGFLLALSSLMAENDQSYKKLWWENRKISREENWPRGQGTDLRRQKRKERKDQKGMWPATGENSHLRHLKCPWAEAPDLWTTHTDKSVREGTLHWLDYVLGPEGKNCLNIFFFFFFLPRGREAGRTCVHLLSWGEALPIFLTPPHPNHHQMPGF